MTPGNVSTHWDDSGPPTDNIKETIAGNVQRVRARLHRAAVHAGRDPSTVRMVAVSKKFPTGHVRAAVDAGLTDFGENKVQEAFQKIAELEGARLGITWHLIGHLQSNKARRAARGFAWIHSVDSRDLLIRIDQAAQECGTRPNVLVQVDLAGEATKHGATIEETRQILHAGSRCTAVRMRGLMVLPPWSADAELARPFFRRLRELRDELVRDGVNGDILAELSMGMSQDLEVAVEEGATLVRIGTAIFGPRPTGEGRVEEDKH